MSKSSGFLITLEGGEGCGKSTQIRLLYAALRRAGVKVFLTREPGGTRTGDAIRSVLLDSKNKGMSGACETLLYMASRAQLVSEVLRPKIDAGYVVLCDRWLDATVAYQGFGEGVSVQWIRSLGDSVTQGVRPRRSLYLDLPPATGMSRIRKRRSTDRMEKKSAAFHRRVRRGFLWIARKEPRRFKRLALTAGDDVRAVHEKIKEALRDVFPSL